MADRVCGRFSSKTQTNAGKARVTALQGFRNAKIKLPQVDPSIEHSYALTSSTENTVFDHTIQLSDENNENEVESHTWKEGRRIVNIHHLAVQLQEGCQKCKKALHLIHIVSEVKKGLGCIFKIRCKRCQHLTNINTDTQHTKEGKSKRSVWDVNTKLALGVIHAGMGCQGINKLLATLNIPEVSHSMLKEREREVGPVVETLAKSSCEDAAQKEVSLCESSSVTASFDGGWQKRGSGHAYNSLSGHASLIGEKTKKIILYDVRCKDCRTCQRAEAAQRLPNKHDCRKNWTGSAKAMESSMCVSMIKGLKNTGISVGTLVMDEDSTCIAKARTEVDGSIKKARDSNHLKETFTSKLYSLSKKHKQLTSTVISHIGKCFMYALKQNSDDVKKLEANFAAIVPHLFGNHLTCDLQWCGYLKNSEQYRPNHLPYKKYLTSETLQNDLNNVFNNYITNSQKLLNISSSQGNEAFNSKVASKNPKNKHLSASESTSYRVACAVADSNIGSHYVSQVNENLLLSPGELTKRANEKADLKRKAQTELQQSLSTKKIRSLKKEKTRRESNVKELREGTTYQSGVALEQINLEALTEIPPPMIEPQVKNLEPGDYEEVFFDLETTGLGLHSGILQISACTSSGDVFNTYVATTQQVTTGASKVTGLSTQDGQVYKNGLKVDSIPTKQALESFNKWLSNLSKPVVLIAHNAKFDSSVLMNSFNNVLPESLPKIVGFLDTLPLFRYFFKEQKNYKLETLVNDILKLTFCAHDALEDCTNLGALYQFTKQQHSVGINDFLMFTFSLQYMYLKKQHADITERNLLTLNDMIRQSVLTNFMSKKIASSGLNFNSLKLAYTRDKYFGIKFLFGEKVNGKCRVTNSKTVIDKCNQFLEQN